MTCSAALASQLGTPADGSICGVASVRAADVSPLPMNATRWTVRMPDSRYHSADYGVVFRDLIGKRWDVPRIKVPAPACRLTFSHKGDRLTLATSDDERDNRNQVLIWELNPPQWVRIARAHIAYARPPD
jgi:hypothetical protein